MNKSNLREAAWLSMLEWTERFEREKKGLIIYESEEKRRKEFEKLLKQIQTAEKEE